MKSEEGKDREHNDDEADEIDDAVHGARSSSALQNSLAAPVFRRLKKILIAREIPRLRVNPAHFRATGSRNMRSPEEREAVVEV